MKLLLTDSAEVLSPERSEFLSAFASIVRKNGTLYLYYTYNGEPMRHLIGVATSTDNGKTWTRHKDNPVINRGVHGSWKDREVWCPNVWVENETWYMLFTGRNKQLNLAVGLAVSDDGFNFTERPTNPILTGTKGTWDEHGIEAWGIIKEHGKYTVYYSTLRDEPRKVGRAFSVDLMHWSKNPKPLFSNANISFFTPFPFRTTNDVGLFVCERTLSTGIFRIKLYAGSDFDHLKDEGSLTLPYELKSLDAPTVLSTINRMVLEDFTLYFAGSVNDKSPAHWTTYSIDAKVVERKALHIAKELPVENIPKVIANAKLHNLPLDIRSKKKHGIHHTEMPSLLRGYTHYVDLAYLPELSKTAYEALALGLTVIRWDGKEVTGFPEANKPENVVNSIMSRIRLVAKHWPNHPLRILHVFDTAGCATAIALSMDKYCGTESKVINRTRFNQFGFTEKSWDCSASKFGVRMFLEARKYDVIVVHSQDRYVPWLRKIYRNKTLVMYYHGSDLRMRGWANTEQYWSKADVIFVSTQDLANLPGAPKVTIIPVIVGN